MKTVLFSGAAISATLLALVFSVQGMQDTPVSSFAKEGSCCSKGSCSKHGNHHENHDHHAEGDNSQKPGCCDHNERAHEHDSPSSETKPASSGADIAALPTTLSSSIGTLQLGNIPPPSVDNKPSEEHGSNKDAVRVSVILVSYTGAESGPRGEAPYNRSKQAAFDLAKQISDQAKNDFKAALSKGDSGSFDSPVSFGRGLLPSALENALFALSPGSISEPLETPRGFWVVKRAE